ncbi:hypothetical protein L1887_20642 [Cichorium endivia]|nr:hypothetical protein L1887_20642 [Cichorium endivia]
MFTSGNNHRHPDTNLKIKTSEKHQISRSKVVKNIKPSANQNMKPKPKSKYEIKPQWKSKSENKSMFDPRARTRWLLSLLPERLKLWSIFKELRVKNFSSPAKSRWSRTMAETNMLSSQAMP